ncbi:MAG: hypothetical protein QXV17_14645, partial [Candidatus Micrarchaeaceae archaeon]
PITARDQTNEKLDSIVSAINDFISTVNMDIDSLEQKIQENMPERDGNAKKEVIIDEKSVKKFQNAFTSMDKNEVRYLVDAVLGQIAQYMREKKPRIVLRGVGVFILKEKPPGEGKAFGKTFERKKGYWYYQFRGKRFE